jgi:hypothetical protein
MPLIEPGPLTLKVDEPLVILQVSVEVAAPTDALELSDPLI